MESTKSFSGSGASWQSSRNGTEISARILTASVRHPMHIVEAAMLGSDVATVPYGVLKKAMRHSLTDAGLEAFLKDWKRVAAQKS